MITNAFILNSDYDGPKEYSDLKLKLTIPAHTPQAYATEDYTATVLAPTGAFATLTTMSCSLFPNKTIGTVQFVYEDASYDGFHTWRLLVYAKKLDTTHYLLKATLTSGEPVSIPEITIGARVRLFTIRDE